MCKKGYAGTGTATQYAGSASCAKNDDIFATKAITNCEYHISSGNNTNACYSCKADFAVASTGTSCKAFTTDSNCRT